MFICIHLFTWVPASCCSGAIRGNTLVASLHCLPLLICCILYNEGEIGYPDAEEVIKTYCKLFTFGFGKEIGKVFLHPGFGYSPPFL